MKISSVEEMRQLDRRAVEQYGITEELLMENAGLAVFFVIQKEIGIARKKFVVFCATGNNGGDGLVVARKLHSQGGQVKVFILGDRQKFKGAARLNLEIARKLPIELVDLQKATDCQRALQEADVVVDGIFGTGLDREVGGKYREVIELINNSGKLVVSIDIPSGIHGNTGQVMGVAVKADYTITFGLPKLGLLLYPGFQYCGKLYVTHISFPPQLYDANDLKVASNSLLPLPPRNPDTHKGSYGKVLFIAGSSNYLGAPYFAALSFLKAGGGLSFLATSETVSAYIGTRGSEIIFRPQIPTESGSIALENKQGLVEFSETVDMVVMGPGLSLNEETQELVRELATEISKPLLIDGDGLTAVSRDLSVVKKRKAPTILTPHPGEMSRLIQKPISEIARNKIDILRAACKDLKAIIVLKGAHSLIGMPDGRIFVNLSGNPGMATAGSGDVLTGTIAAMYGLGLAVEDAVRMGVFMHGFAGDLAAAEKGEDGIVAGDIMEKLPEALKRYRLEFATLAENEYDKIFKI